MTATALVVTSVHWPDDTRIRERLCRTLAEEFDVVLATKEPGPTDHSGLTWRPLRGGRIARMWAAARLTLGSDWDVLVIHDPELVPLAMLVRVLRRRPVVFDVHEDVPATALTRDWVPEILRGLLVRALGRMLLLAEKSVRITLAEPGYQHLFRQRHVVFPNYPDTSGYPDPTQGDGSAVYLGDVTRERGALVMAEAVRVAGVPLRVIGPVSPSLEHDIYAAAGGRRQITIEGRLPNSQALEVVREASVGLSPLQDTPNYRNSIPTKILEYLALGVPVVATDLPGTREVVGGVDGVELVPPGDADSMAAAITRAMSPESRAAVAEQVGSVRDRFRWPSRAVLDFYRALV